MRAIVLLILALLLPAGPVRAQAEERTVYASVVEQERRARHGARRRASSSCGRTTSAREVLRASTATEPMHIAVLVDTSQAMEEHMLDVRTASARFFKQAAASTKSRSSASASARLCSPTTRAMRRAWKRRSVQSSRARAAAPTFSTPSSRPQMALQTPQGDASAHHRLSPRRVPSSASGTTRSVIDALRESGATLHTLMLNRPGIGDGQPRRTGAAQAVANGTKMHGRTPRRSAYADGAGRSPAVAGDRARESVPGCLRAPSTAGPAEEPRGDRETSFGYSPRAADAVTNASYRHHRSRNRIGRVVIAADHTAGGDADRDDTQNEAGQRHIACDRERSRHRCCGVTARKRIPLHAGSIQHGQVHLPDRRRAACARPARSHGARASVSRAAVRSTGTKPAARSTRIDRWLRRRDRRAEDMRIRQARPRNTADTPVRDIR